MNEISPSLPLQRPLFVTERTDTWWLGPTATAAGLLFFVAYLTWAAFQGAHFYVGPMEAPYYLSPLYSPWIQADWWPFSPAFLILWAPGGFRFTCYYYRKAYYRAFYFSPPGCAVGGRTHNYKGERVLFLFQNLHRFFLYLAILFVFLLAYDAWLAFQFPDGWGIGAGSIVLTLNAIFLGAFTFGCNSLRHLVGGNVDCFSCVSFGRSRFKLWRIVTRFNEHHMQWAWISLFWVCFTDLYVRLVSMGIIGDLRIL